jgi:hypothetical protein
VFYTSVTLDPIIKRGVVEDLRLVLPSPRLRRTSCATSVTLDSIIKGMSGREAVVQTILHAAL